MNIITFWPPLSIRSQTCHKRRLSSLSLPERKTFFSNFRFVARFEQSKVALQSTLVQDCTHIFQQCLQAAQLNIHLSCIESRHKVRQKECWPESNFGTRIAASAMSRTRMVSFWTQDSCAAYATPPLRGRLNQDVGPEGVKCISPVQ
jgi:hypothetical protein